MGNQPCRKAATYKEQQKYRINEDRHPYLEWVRNHDPSAWASEDISYFRPRGPCDGSKILAY
jgi:hypothetical protein